jgi:hypothetical protein
MYSSDTFEALVEQSTPVATRIEDAGLTVSEAHPQLGTWNGH